MVVWWTAWSWVRGGSRAGGVGVGGLWVCARRRGCLFEAAVVVVGEARCTFVAAHGIGIGFGLLTVAPFGRWWVCLSICSFVPSFIHSFVRSSTGSGIEKV
ncbi:hypothetical protein F4779DRAFT_575730 [Xylariaceae sp. FL0662B]|nr:hypothetical protein F4779DRAFT_575730 [Xylariaceae sp. FL0662B]